MNFIINVYSNITQKLSHLLWQFLFANSQKPLDIFLEICYTIFVRKTKTNNFGGVRYDKV